MNGLSPEMSEKPYPSSPDQNLFTPPHSGQDAAREISSSERRQYNKALKAMYEIVRLGSKRLEKPVTDGDHHDDDDMIPETVTETSETEEDLSGLLFYFYSFALLIGLKYVSKPLYFTIFCVKSLATFLDRGINLEFSILRSKLLILKETITVQ